MSDDDKVSHEPSFTVDPDLESFDDLPPIEDIPRQERLVYAAMADFLDPVAGETLELLERKIELLQRAATVSRKLQTVPDMPEHLDPMPGIAIDDPLSLSEAEAEAQSTDALKQAAREARNDGLDTARMFSRLLGETGITEGIGNWGLQKGIPTPIRRRTAELTHNHNLVEADDDAFREAADELEAFVADYYRRPRRRFERVLALIYNFGLHDHSGIGSVFHEYARSVTPDDADESTLDRLARPLQQAVTDGDDTDRTPLTDRIANYVDETDGLPPTAIKRSADSEGYFDRCESNGMLFLDEIGLEWCYEWTDSEGFRGTLEDAKQTARERWQHDRNSTELLTLWADPNADVPSTLQPVQTVAEHLWNNEFRQEWERYHNNAPSLVAPNFDKTEQVAFRPNRQVEQNNNQLELIEGDETPEAVAQTKLPNMPEQRLRTIINHVDSGTDALRSMTGVRLLVYAIREGFEQKFATNLRNPNRLEFEGGFKALADAIGEGNNKSSRTKLRNILKAGQRWRMDWPGGEAGGLWTYTYESAEGKNERAFLQVTLGDPLMPQYTHRLKGSSRILVPIVELMPPVSSPRYYTDQAIFQLAFVRGMVARRKGILDDGGAHIPEAEAWQIAKRIGLDSQTVMNKALDRWCRDGDDAPAFLEEVKDNHYLLADNDRYGKARRFLVEQAKRSKSASLRGKQGGRPAANSDD